MNAENVKIAVIIPAYKVQDHIQEVVKSLGPEVWKIYVVDDCCPQKSGELVQGSDERLSVIFHEKNQGVGGATISGYRQAIEDGAHILVKVDGDGQMDPAELKHLVAPLINGRADYAKGNRFFDLRSLKGMPLLRLIGNSGLSFLTKASTGYWSIMDPTNGYTAIHANVASYLPWERLERGYFFESDMLYHLNLLRAVVRDVPIPALYGEETSSLKISLALFEFWHKNTLRIISRIFYVYVLREFQIATILLVAGLALMGFGFGYGSFHWYKSLQTGIPALNGTIMLAALPLLLGFQMLLNFLASDYQGAPSTPIHPILRINSCHLAP